MKTHSIEYINHMVELGEAGAYINAFERQFDGRIEEIARDIAENAMDNRIVLTAGPSSSGKTTFSLKLCAVLKEKRMDAHVISLDNFFLAKDALPLNENGEQDYETVFALDLDLVQQCFNTLFAEGKADFPRFDFAQGKQIKNDHVVAIKEDTILIVEGMHALNDEILTRMPLVGCKKIYISLLSDMTQGEGEVFLKKQNIRLLRRIVRDYKYRGSSLRNTLSMWSRVLEGDYKYVIPTKQTADIFVDTYFAYDPGVIKPFFMEHLETIEENIPHRETIEDITKTLEQVKEIDEALLPETSLLREFVGGSIYYDN